jgi:hypothetical protein
MPRITNWQRESRSPTLAYRNIDNRSTSRPASSAGLLPVQVAWSNPCRRLPRLVGGYETKDATSFPNEPRKRPAPALSCPECPNDDVRVGEKAADGAKVQRW